jgi:hypothetical protein
MLNVIILIVEVPTSLWTKLALGIYIPLVRLYQKLLYCYPVAIVGSCILCNFDRVVEIVGVGETDKEKERVGEKE